MTRNKKLILAGLLSITALGGAAVTANAMADRGPMRADANGDGIVSRSEFFTAAETQFKDRDSNGDRTLAGTELIDKRGRFARQDTNNDGRLSYTEAAANTAGRFARIDADRDGKLTPEELGPRPGRHHGGRHGPGGDRFDLAQGPDGDRPGAGLARIDANGDGKITRDEMRAQADQRFDRLDANRDGVIDRAELRALRGPGMGPRGMAPGMNDGPPPPPPPADDGQ